MYVLCCRALSAFFPRHTCPAARRAELLWRRCCGQVWCLRLGDVPRRCSLPCTISTVRRRSVECLYGRSEGGRGVRSGCFVRHACRPPPSPCLLPPLPHVSRSMRRVLAAAPLWHPRRSTPVRNVARRHVTRPPDGVTFSAPSAAFRTNSPRCLRRLVARHRKPATPSEPRALRRSYASYDVCRTAARGPRRRTGRSRSGRRRASGGFGCDAPIRWRAASEFLATLCWS